jgi:hypothetical protein
MSVLHFSWPLMLFAAVAPDTALQQIGKIHLLSASQPRAAGTVASVRLNYLKQFRADNGDLSRTVEEFQENPSRSENDARDASRAESASSPLAQRVLRDLDARE